MSYMCDTQKRGAADSVAKANQRIIDLFRWFPAATLYAGNVPQWYLLQFVGEFLGLSYTILITPIYYGCCTFIMHNHLNYS
jgi:hypothetical protein